MIAKGKAVSHEGALIEYAMGKKDAEYVTSHGILSSPVLMVDMSAQEILDEMQQHRKRFQHATSGRQLQNTILRFELCPTEEETRGWNREDWTNLINEFIKLVDSLDYVKTKSGKKKTPKTNIANTQWTAFLHHDGADGCDHVHLLANRIDLDGNTINDSMLLPKAELAANIINERRGWKQSLEIGKEHREELKKMCFEILKQMPRWDWEDYFRRIHRHGFEYYRTKDSKGNQRGYSIFYGNASIPASEIDRRLTWGKIEATWRALHPVAVVEGSTDFDISRANCSDYVKVNGSGRINGYGSNISKSEDTSFTAYPYNTSNAYASSEYKSKYVWYDFSDIKDFSTRSGGHTIAISKELDDIIRSEVTLPDPDDYEDEEDEYVAPVVDDIMRTAVLLIGGYIEAATHYAESSGGGGGSSSGWRKDKDDDDERWARRCAWMASRMCAPAHRPKKIKRSHYHR